MGDQRIQTFRIHRFKHGGLFLFIWPVVACNELILCA
ncbi:Uncharacterised protein [Vibrio cholerae]|nr:Uncharacterised protein [Vibrio cholerae]